MPERVNVYIDGFNLYFGLRAKRWRRYYWLDMHLLSTNLLRAQQFLGSVKYFTSMVSAPPHDPDKPLRQQRYIEAMQCHTPISVYFGHYLDKPITCRNCQQTWDSHEEKMTDVNIAVQLLLDAEVDPKIWTGG